MTQETTVKLVKWIIDTMDNRLRFFVSFGHTPALSWLHPNSVYFYDKPKGLTYPSTTVKRNYFCVGLTITENVAAPLIITYKDV